MPQQILPETIDTQPRLIAIVSISRYGKNDKTRRVTFLTCAEHRTKLSTTRRSPNGRLNSPAKKPNRRVANVDVSTN